MFENVVKFFKGLGKNDKDLKSKDAENIVSAVWTSELSNEESMMVLEQARDFVNAHQNLLLGVEDLHFLSKK